jgi:hypothetical protein
MLLHPMDWTMASGLQGQSLYSIVMFKMLLAQDGHIQNRPSSHPPSRTEPFLASVRPPTPHPSALVSLPELLLSSAVTSCIRSLLN